MIGGLHSRACIPVQVWAAFVCFLIMGFPEPSNKNKQWVHTCFFNALQNDAFVKTGGVHENDSLFEEVKNDLIF